ncbi:DUF6516 family protein [Janthinobacterium sp. SUN206]|uniref:toxin-antitoxin system TumE family protein n=1 Tax=Janthinobacterium sp. SUN206 TaxID=3014787 RepID=UPI0027134C54|nr:DUF6516 family protein [Janthinobacterium sp. SUN206]MDO8068595.1 DUF6516 family protein [Janthinobacterium sp. SUN206]
MSIHQMIQICFSHGLDGRNTDTCVKSMAVNVLKPNMPVVAIEMKSRSDLLQMMKTADNTHIYIGAGVFHFNAFYAATDNFPAPRIYYMKTADLMAVGTIGAYMQQHGVTLPPMNDERFSPLIEDKRYAKRYEQWHTRWEANSKAFKGLLDGRVRNTAVEQGIWLSSDGGCMMCGDKTDLMSTTTVIGAKGIMIGLQLCGQHEAEAMDHSTLLNYISEKMGVPAPFLVGAKVVRHGQQTIDMTCDAVRDELKCVIEKIDGQTITAMRKSGFRLIIRQDALNDYAYNIQDPTGKPIARIDSADHHKVEYGPDHVHRDLSKSKKNQVEPSFTYGFAVADLKAIRQLVETAEEKWTLAQVSGKVT